MHALPRTVAVSLLALAGGLLTAPGMGAGTWAAAGQAAAGVRHFDLPQREAAAERIALGIEEHGEALALVRGDDDGQRDGD